jgi:hypothetical protein
MTPMLLQGPKPNRSKAQANNQPEQKEEASNETKSYGSYGSSRYGGDDGG